MQWLRLYDDVLDDPKVQRLPAELFKHWINLLCLANKGTPRGTLPELEDIAFRLRVSVDEARKLCMQLHQVGLLTYDEVGFSPHNWEHRQFRSDDVNARVKAYRQRNVTPKTDETLQETFRATLDVTPPDTDTDTDTELQQPRARPREDELPTVTVRSANGAAPRNGPTSRFAAAVGEKRFATIAEQFASVNVQLDRHWLEQTLIRYESQNLSLPPPQMRAALKAAFLKSQDALGREGNRIQNPPAWVAKQVETAIRDEQTKAPP